MIKISVCTSCGDPFDSTGYELCPECQYDRRYIKLQLEPVEENEDDTISE
jgi:NMD protein affecting ribosome stability and mRNA decay